MKEDYIRKTFILKSELQKAEDDVGTPPPAERFGEPICEGEPFDEHSAMLTEKKPLRPGLRTLLFLLIDCLVIGLVCWLLGIF